MKTTLKHDNAAKNFSAQVRRALIAQGIVIVSATWLPGRGPDGRADYAQGQTGYICHKGQSEFVRTYAQIREMAS